MSMVKTVASVVMLVLFIGFVYLLFTQQIKMEDLWQSTVDYVSNKYEDFEKQREGEQPTPIEKELVQEKAVAQPSDPDPQLKIVENKVEPKKPLPKLIDSDKSVQDELNSLATQKQLLKHLRLDAIIQRYVITIDNMPKKNIPAKYLLGKPPAGKFIVRSDHLSQDYISKNNFKRYETHLKLVESIDTKRILAIYQHYYPLFQEAYEDIGYKNLQFNDRLLEVISLLLETPDIKGPIKLTHPSVFYRYADPQLEALSAGQKMILRMGYTNAKRLKAKLRELEFELSTMLF